VRVDPGQADALIDRTAADLAFAYRAFVLVLYMCIARWGATLPSRRWYALSLIDRLIVLTSRGPPRWRACLCDPPSDKD
jgi:hypothetical protein